MLAVYMQNSHHTATHVIEHINAFLAALRTAEPELFKPLINQYIFKKSNRRVRSNNILSLQKHIIYKILTLEIILPFGLTYFFYLQ